MVQQHDGLGVLVTFGARLTDNDTVCRVTLIGEIEPLGELTQKIRYPLLVMRRSRNCVQLLEDA
jgi:hypothetical protein